MGKLSSGGSDGATGILYLVSTPIGNLEDITYRALRVLGDVDLIAAEDTRTTGVLLKHFSIDRPMVSFHSHNESRKVDGLVGNLRNGMSLALVTDAGTPGISDPAFLLVRAAIECEIPVVAIPGPTAFVPALVISGLPTDRFVFEGFLPVKKGRRRRIADLAVEPRTIILYESPHRVARTIQELYQSFGNRRAAIVREITKKFEEILRGGLAELSAALKERSLKGEIVIVVEGLNRPEKRKKMQSHGKQRNTQATA